MRGQPQDNLNPLYILGPPDHGGQSRQILWTSIQRLPRHGPRQPPTPHDLQHFCGCRHSPLGDSYGSNQGCYGGTSPIDARLISVLLFQQCPHFIDPVGEATEGVQCPHRPLQMGGPHDKHEEGGHYGLPAMPHSCPDVLGGVREADNGDRANLLGSTADEGGMPIVRSGDRGRVTTDVLLDPEWGGPGVIPPPPPPGGRPLP